MDLASSGAFTTASAYIMVEDYRRSILGMGGEQSDRNPTARFWKKVWGCKIPRRMVILAWRCFHEGLPALSSLRRRGCLLEGVCGFCGLKEESITHIFRECWWAQAAWRLALPGMLSYYPSMNSADWLMDAAANLSNENFARFLCGLSFIWEERNSRFHGGRALGVETVFERINALMFQLKRLSAPRSGFNHTTCSNFFVTCDGAWKVGEVRSGIAAVAWENDVIRAVKVQVVYGCKCASEVEGRAIVLGMDLADSLQDWKGFLFKTDSSDAFSTAFMGTPKTPGDLSWQPKCSEWLEKRRDWEVDLVPRDDCALADLLAKRARQEDWEWNDLNKLPWVSDLVSSRR